MHVQVILKQVNLVPNNFVKNIQFHFTLFSPYIAPTEGPRQTIYIAGELLTS